MIRLANAPCSWGALELLPAGSAPNYAQVLDEIAATGYEGTELGDWGFMPTDARALRDELARRRLSLVGAFVPVALVDAGCHELGERVALRTAELLAAASDAQPLIVLSDDNGTVDARVRHAGRVRADHGLDAAGWDTFAQGALRIARSVKAATGLRTAFHAHCAGYVETAAEVDALLARTDPDVLGFCLDTGHLTYAGADPLDVLQRYGARVWHVHVKDCDPAVAARARSADWDYFTAIRHGVFCELGRGSVDVPALVSALGRDGYDGWIVVEQDVLPGMGTPAASAVRSREYLRGIGI